jgi:hypothetical protein
MRRVSIVSAVVAAALTLPAPLAAQDGLAADQTNHPVMVTIGQVECFRLRVPDGWLGMSIEQREEKIQNVFAKYLGGPGVRWTSKTIRGREHLYMNGDFLLAVTPEDARATGVKRVADLAKSWMARLADAFRKTHANPK